MAPPSLLNKPPCGAQAGINFQEIWAWEVQATDPVSYWQSVPGVYRQRLHFYNTPISSDFSDPSHPLSIIRSIYRPGDRLPVAPFSLDTASVQ